MPMSFSRAKVRVRPRTPAKVKDTHSTPGAMIGVSRGDEFSAKLRITSERMEKARIAVTMSLARNSVRTSFHTIVITVVQNPVTGLPA